MNNLISLTTSKSPKAIYKADSPAMFITVGSQAGVGQLFGFVLWSWFVVMAKSKGLLVDLFKGHYNVK